MPTKKIFDHRELSTQLNYILYGYFDMKNYDLLIIGGGPAGLTAAIYAARGGASVLLIEKAGVGGQAALTADVENYPGILSSGGYELAALMAQQAEKFGAQFLYDEVTAFNLTGTVKTISTAYSGDFSAPAIILCMGARPRKLQIPGENEFAGRGVSYCATCDGAFFKNKTVTVSGGGNTAVEDALYLSRFAAKVRLIHRRDTLRAERILAEHIKNSSVEIVWNSVVTAATGNDKLSAVIVKNVLTGTEASLNTDGLFVAIGQVPYTDNLPLKLSDGGYIPVNSDMSTKIPGVFAAGDITEKPLRQIVTAAADGAVAAQAALKRLFN